MGIETLKTGAIGVALLLALSACATTTDSSANSSVSRAEFRGELPSDVYDFAFANAIADQIASECRSLTLNRSQINKTSKSLTEKYEAEGYRESDFKYLARNLPRKRVQDDAIAYIQKRGIVIGEAETFCAAGRLEISNETSIGAFLKG
ncbi:DUF5333 family protein [Ruegeria arenilitoris]|uniref:DUF5333 family protein n=1 Tax=Ruegeria arenilitoris TaxID=1173585 RepID=UPI00147A281D|nr:DUF5333 family protein [Ruegeria arenilitoris]